ncbi:MAG: AMP-binding protein [Alphaproteobacteria bacterium]|nr:AMP-binding protein [Alphaproteobacteria bacterium]
MTGAALSYFHRGGDTALLGGTIPEHFADVCRQHGDAEAIVCAFQNRRLTYAQLAEEIDRVACGLVALGFGKGDRIGVWSTNNVEWLLLQMATARIGAVLVNINPANRPRELAYALERSQVQGLFTIPAFRTSEYVEMLTELVPELKNADPTEDLSSKALPDLRRVVVYDPAAPEQTDRPWSGFGTWQDMLAAGEHVAEEELDARTGSLDRDDPINIQYTSGTTGFPKAVVLTHHNLLNNAYFTAQAMHFTAADRLAVPVPFYHCFGMVLANLVSFSVGACVVIPAPHFDPLATLEAIAAERCTAVHGVPTMFIAQLEHAEFERFDLTSLRTGIMAGAPCPEALMNRVIADMHCSEILIGYGQTEASPLTHLTTSEDTLERRTQTVGRNLQHQEVKVIDPESSQTVPLGEVGEICFRGYHVMRGYYGDPEKTAETVDEAGWLHSGDLGTMDAEGYVQITGRLKDMIIRGGENIYPAEIEAYLFTHPKIAQVCVFGVPDEFFGEEIMAWIELHGGEHASEDEIRAFCKDGLAHFKTPRYIWFVDEFPMTVTGKLQKFRMREIAEARMGKDAASA